MAKFCRDCKHSLIISNRLICTHHSILQKHPEILSKLGESGVPCIDQRRLNWFAPCGLSGKLWKAKDGYLDEQFQTHLKKR
jgi:hypothetical protein